MNRDETLNAGLSNISSLSQLGSHKPKESFILIPIDEIVLDEFQDRIINTDSDAFKRFCLSIRSTKGNTDPVDVVTLKDGTYRLVSGYTRVIACKAEGIEVVRAIVRPFESEHKLLLERLTENSGRNDLNLVEAAAAYQSRLDAGISLEDIIIASTLAKSTIKSRLAINKYPDEVKQLVNDKLVNNLTNLSKLKNIYEHNKESFFTARGKIEAGETIADILALFSPSYDEIKPQGVSNATESKQNSNENEQTKETDLTSKKLTIKRGKNITLPYSVFSVLVKRAMRLKDGGYDYDSDEFERKAQKCINRIIDGKDQ